MTAGRPPNGYDHLSNLIFIGMLVWVAVNIVECSS